MFVAFYCSRPYMIQKEPHEGATIKSIPVATVSVFIDIPVVGIDGHDASFQFVSRFKHECRSRQECRSDFLQLFSLESELRAFLLWVVHQPRVTCLTLMDQSVDKFMSAAIGVVRHSC